MIDTFAGKDADRSNHTLTFKLPGYIDPPGLHQAPHKWADECPVTKRPFYNGIDFDEGTVPTYGTDSMVYTIPEKDAYGRRVWWGYNLFAEKWNFWAYREPDAIPGEEKGEPIGDLDGGGYNNIEPDVVIDGGGYE